MNFPACNTVNAAEPEITAFVVSMVTHIVFQLSLKHILFRRCVIDDVPHMHCFLASILLTFAFSCTLRSYMI
jgi:hypothetical protein